MEEVEMKGVEKEERIKEEVGQEKKAVEVYNGRLRGAGGGRGGSKSPLEEVQEEENEKGMNEKEKKRRG